MGTSMRNPATGAVVFVPDDQVSHATSQGYEPVGAVEAGNALTRPEDDNSGILGKASAAVTSGLSGLTAGASDVALRGILNKGGQRAMAEARENNPITSTVFGLGGATLGALASGGDSLLADSPAAAITRLGAATSERIGGGISGAVASGAVEGSIYGAGGGVSQLAMSQDPLTAEHVASTIGTNAILGAGIGGAAGGVFKAGERALGRAADVMTEAAAAKQALGALPDDLAGADMPSLRAADVEAATARRAEISAEKQSLESIRVNQREEIAAQVKDLHDSLATERPIFHSLSDGQGNLLPELANIEGANDARVQLAKSFKSMRAQFDDPIGIAKNPDVLERPLRMRIAALEQLQEATPQIQAALGNDSRAAVLDHVGDALSETKDQIAKIQSVSKSQPLTGSRLTELENSPSVRQQAIAAARDAMSTHPEAGILQKSAQAAAFGGVTAAAHMIPGVGVAAPFLGAGASKLVGRLFEHLAGNGAEMAGKAADVVSAMTGGARSAAKYAPMVATKALAAMKFAEGPDAKSGSLDDQFARVSHELRSQTMYAPDGSVQMRPDARQAMADRLGPVGAVNPPLADKIESNKARVVSYLSGILPRKREVGGIQTGPDKSKPSDLEMRSFAASCYAAEHPTSVLDGLAHGSITPEAAAAFRNCYPAWFADVQNKLLTAAPQMAKAMPYKQRMAWSVFAGVPIDASMEPNVRSVLQRSFTSPAPDPTADVPGMQAPKMRPSFGSMGSIKRSIPQPTPAEARANARSTK